LIGAAATAVDKSKPRGTDAAGGDNAADEKEAEGEGVYEYGMNIDGMNELGGVKAMSGPASQLAAGDAAAPWCPKRVASMSRNCAARGSYSRSACSSINPGMHSVATELVSHTELVSQSSAAQSWSSVTKS